MIYPSIQELLKKSEDENGNERLNKYTLVMASAKCARIITNDNRMKKINEKNSGERRDYKKDPPKEEKAVSTAVKELKAGSFEVFFEGEAGYDESVVDVRAIDVDLEAQIKAMEEKEKLESRRALDRNDKVRSNKEDYEEIDTTDLMGATEVYVETYGMDERYEDPSINDENK
jgi:hypothetical protein